MSYTNRHTHKNPHTQGPRREFLGKCVMWLRFAALSKITQTASQVSNKSANDLLFPQKCVLNMMRGNDFIMTLPSNILAVALRENWLREKEREVERRRGETAGRRWKDRVQMECKYLGLDCFGVCKHTV